MLRALVLIFVVCTAVRAQPDDGGFTPTTFYDIELATPEPLSSSENASHSSHFETTSEITESTTTPTEASRDIGDTSDSSTFDSNESTFSSESADSEVLLACLSSNQSSEDFCGHDYDGPSTLTISPIIDPGDSFSAIGTVSNLSANATGKHVHANWTHPVGYPDVDYYRIVFLDLDTRTAVEFNTSKTYWDYYQTEPCTFYQLSVYAIVNKEQGEEAQRLVEIDPQLPGPPVLDNINSTSVLEPTPLTTLEVTWKSPLDAARCSKFYIVEFQRKYPHEGSLSYQELNVTETKLKIVNLDACEVYIVKIKAAINDEQLGDALEQEIQVDGRVPMRPTTTRAGGTSTTIKLLVNNEDIRTVCQLFVAKFVCQLGRTSDEPVQEIINEEIINNQMTEYTSTIEGLEPFTMYNCYAVIRNELGWSEIGRDMNFVTEEDVPGRPKKVEVSDVKPVSFRASWDEPKDKNGKIQTYRGYVRLIEILYPPGPGCPPMNTTSKEFTNSEDQRNHTVDGLYPFSRYSVQVAAATSKGVGDYSDTAFVTTEAAPSDPVQNFSYEITNPNSKEEYNAVVNFTWSHPCRTNGVITEFYISMVGTRQGFEDHIVHLSEATTTHLHYELPVTQVLPSYSYNATIVPVSQKPMENEPRFVTFTMPAGVPRTESIVNWGTLETTRAPNPTKTAHISVKRNILNSHQGTIKYIAILLSQKNCQPDPDPESGFYSDWKEERSWSDVYHLDCVPQYQTTPRKFPPPEPRDRDAPAENMEFVLGKDDCNPNSKDYCNGHLRPGTPYAVTVRIFTELGYSDLAPLYFETESLINVLVIVVGVSGLLLVSFLIGLIVLHRNGTLTRSSSILVSPYLNEPNDVTPKSFIQLYNELTANKNEKLTQEYKTIESIVPAGNMTYNAAKQNSSKNRYSNIMPFDFNRVILSTGDGDPDYINASFIDGFKIDREYIATQGPKDNTCGDFWRMVLEMRVEAVVMLTLFKEGNKAKCAEYFPKFNEFRYYDEAEVKCTQELAFSNYKKRIFTIEKGGLTHQVTHYHFLKWPDHDCPKNPVDLIKFVKLVRSERKAPFSPVVVHCSAGVGRTGTFIALDIIMQKIKTEKKLNIYEIVKQLRMQRVRMVQTSGQYIYLYKCAYEIVVKEKDWKQKLKDKLNGKEKEVQDKTVETTVPGQPSHKISDVSVPSIRAFTFVSSPNIDRKDHVKRVSPDDLESNI